MGQNKVAILFFLLLSKYHHFTPKSFKLFLRNVIKVSTRIFYKAFQNRDSVIKFIGKSNAAASTATKNSFSVPSTASATYVEASELVDVGELSGILCQIFKNHLTFLELLSFLFSKRSLTRF